MSDGYTPVFGSVFDGTLYGKWPASAVWLTMLALCDKRGNVDMSFQAIAGRTGWPMDLLLEGIGALMQPDPYSRSSANDGRRLIPLVEGRNWGWHVVNHALYREKARLQAKDAARTASGLDAARKRTERGVSPDVPRSPSESPDVPLSDANANTSEEQHRKRGADTRRGSRIPDPFPISEELCEWAKREAPDVDLQKATAEFLDYWRGVTGQKGSKLDWPATWRNRMREVQGRIASKRPVKPQEEPRGLKFLNP